MTADRLHKGECGCYSDTDIESMRAECCGHEYDKLVGSGDLCDILYEGVIGWRHIEIDEVIYYWEENILPDHTSNIKVMKDGMEVSNAFKQQEISDKEKFLANAFEQQEISDRIERGEERPDE